MYFDVSVPWVRSTRPIHSGGSDWLLHQPGFPIRRSPDQRSFASFPEHIAGYHVLLRFSMPRHPPYTLKSLTTFIDHRQTTITRGASSVGVQTTVCHQGVVKRVQLGRTLRNR